jgi:predicted transcriptional regulator
MGKAECEIELEREQAEFLDQMAAKSGRCREALIQDAVTAFIDVIADLVAAHKRAVAKSGDSRTGHTAAPSPTTE